MNKMPKLPSRECMLIVQKLQRLVYSFLWYSFPDSRSLHLLFPLTTMSLYLQTQSSFFSFSSNVTFSESSFPNILSNIKLLLPKSFFSMFTLSFIFFMVYDNVRNYVICTFVYDLSFPTRMWVLGEWGFCFSHHCISVGAWWSPNTYLLNEWTNEWMNKLRIPGMVFCQE